MFIVFFFKQKTAYEMRISDWSSDVCSSDLRPWRFAEASLGLADRQELGQRRPGIQHAARALQSGAGVAARCHVQQRRGQRTCAFATVGGCIGCVAQHLEPILRLQPRTDSPPPRLAAARAVEAPPQRSEEHSRWKRWSTK